jgi:chromosome segregation ATPase
LGSPLKSAKSEGGTVSEMESSDSAGKPDKPVLTTISKKKKRKVVDPATIQSILDQLQQATLLSETHQLNTIAALNSAMEEISSLRSQVESLQAAQGTMAGTIESATARVATCETTLQQHSQQIGSFHNSHSRVISQWDSFQQRWANSQGQRGPTQESGHAASFFFGGGTAAENPA